MNSEWLIEQYIKQTEQLQSEIKSMKTEREDLVLKVQRLQAEIDEMRGSQSFRNSLFGRIEAVLAHHSAPACTHEWDINDKGTATTCSSCGARSSDVDAPDAKCSRCEASTVEHCDEKGCGLLGAGNGAPAPKETE